jgi:hypothetical protein
LQAIYKCNEFYFTGTCSLVLFPLIQRTPFRLFNPVVRALQMKGDVLSWNIGERGMGFQDKLINSKPKFE